MLSSTRGWRTVYPTRFSAIFPSECREGTGTDCRLHRLTFSGFHVLAQDGVHRGLVAAAVLAEKRQHVGINAQGNLFLRPRPENRVLKEVGPHLWDIGIVDVFVAHRVNALPVRSGGPFHILCALHDPPFSAK